MTRYELLDRIGVGGMAEIFRGKAVAAGGFEKPVAIKRILPHLSQDTRFVELLIAEAKVLSLLKHRNIVQIFDVGLGDDGQYFLVMEFVDGKDLGAVQRALEASRRRMPFDLVLHVVAEMCDALEHAHAARSPDGKSMSLVHRDVSPSNVILSRAGEVKLTDFGIAKRAEQDATQGGAVRGKFAYISPEQARNEPVDPRSDVFSVGILLWELVTNRRLFSGLDDLSALRSVREGHVPRPSEADPRLPPEIDRILAAATARDRTRRYASAGQLGAELRTLRYSLDVTVGDPATELAKIIESTEEVEKQGSQRTAKPPMHVEFDAHEATVIRIHTADAFSARDNDESIVRARAVIDRFEEEETRLAQLSGDQLRMLRSRAPRDSGEMTAHTAPRRHPSEDEATRTLEPLDLDRIDTPPTLDVPVEHEAPTRMGGAPLVRGARPPTNAPPPVPRRRDPTPPPRPPPFAAPPSLAPPTLQGLPPAPVSAAAAARRTPPAAIPGPGGPPPLGPMPPGMPMGAPQMSPMAQMPPMQPMAQMPPMQPMAPMPMGNAGYPGWGAPNRPSAPSISGFTRATPRLLKPWVLVLAALIMATLAYVVTRAFLR